jgi:hypothetical protein
MRTLTDHEKRTVRIGALLVVGCIICIGGVKAWNFLSEKRLAYLKLVDQAKALKQQIQPYETKALISSNLMAGFHMDPAKLSRAAVVAEASAAIQKAATGGGIQLGPIRETSGRASGKELASMQLEGSGQVSAVMGLLHQFQSLGYPIIVDSVQITAEASRPGTVKFSLAIIILDFDQWKAEEASNG